MRFRLFLILIGVIVLSLASGLGLRFALAAWQEPTAAPPGGNVPAPINVGSGAQTKAGDLTVGDGSGLGLTVIGGASVSGDLYLSDGKAIRIDGSGEQPTILHIGNWGGGPGADVSIWGNLKIGDANFQRHLLVSGGVVIGSPTGGNRGSGALNAERLCIQGNCISGWVLADAFVQGGNSFGTLAVLGTNDNYALAFETNNVERMRIDTAGSGIFYGDFTLQSPTAGSGRLLTVSDNVAGSGHLGRIEVGGTYYGGMQIRTLSNGNLGLRTDGAAPNGNIIFSTGGANERMRITSAGNVGIGTTVPDTALHINHATGWKVQSGAATIRLAHTGGTTFQFDGNYTNLAILGNVGIGTTAPFEKLHVADGSLYLGPDFHDGNYGRTIKIGWEGDPDVHHSIQTTISQGGAAQNGMRFYVHGGTANDNQVLTLALAGSGNVGIGTTAPAHKLVVAGSAPRTYLWPSGGGNPELNFGNQTGDNHWAIYRDTASDELRFWRDNNNVTMTAAGDLNSRRCFGSVYVGQTPDVYNGNRGGYDDANALCNTAIAGSHVCTTQEILETIDCNRASLPTSGQAWISNGPPGFTARANDCKGWTSNVGSGSEIAYGAIWAFDASGGVGWVTTCNMTLKFACCK